MTKDANHQLNGGTASKSPSGLGAFPSIYLAGHIILQMVMVGDAGCESSKQIGREGKNVAPVQLHQKSWGCRNPRCTLRISGIFELHQASEKVYSDQTRITFISESFLS